MKILIVEDDLSFQKLLVRYIEKNLLFCEVKAISNFAELKELNEDFDIYIVDYVLKDSEGEHVEYLLKEHKKVLVLSKYDFFESKLKDRVIEYIMKEDFHSLEYLVRFIRRFYKNRNLTALVVDDSVVVRKFEKSILTNIGLNVVEAKNGKEALEIFKSKEVDIIITDLDMPVMNGEELIFAIREDKNMADLPIMVISAEGDDKFIKMLKFGANDYLKKPFVKEELIIRVNNLLEIYENVKKFKIQVQIDPLTGAFNRMFLESTLDNLFNIHETKTIAMLDIDHFKKINDTYGHQIGDEVLKHFVKIIKDTIRKTDYLVRYGGEEFLLFMPNTTKVEAFVVLQKIRKNLTPCKNVNFTFSAGVADEGETLAEMIKIADERLYKAKNGGRDMVVIK